MKKNLENGLKATCVDMNNTKVKVSIKNGNTKRYFLLCAMLFVLLVVCFIYSFVVGRYNSLSVIDVVKILLNKVYPFFEKTWSIKDEAVVVNMRMPRIIVSIFIGAALSVAGSVYQGVFNNPIASPDTLGISNSASFGAALGIILGLHATGIKTLAFIFGFLTVCFVLLATGFMSKGKNMTVFLVLIGMVVSSTFSALVSSLKYVADPDNQLPQITYWLMGSFGKITDKDILISVMLTCLGIIPLFLMRWHLNMLSLSNEEARTMGVNIIFVRAVSIICATLLTTTSAAMTGGITWIGLIIPHITRIIVGNDYKKNMLVNILIGGLFMLCMDDLARSISPNELPISILTSIVGAPIFFLVIIGNRRKISNED